MGITHVAFRGAISTAVGSKLCVPDTATQVVAHSFSRPLLLEGRLHYWNAEEVAPTLLSQSDGSSGSSDLDDTFVSPWNTERWRSFSGATKFHSNREEVQRSRPDHPLIVSGRRDSPIDSCSSRL